MTESLSVRELIIRKLDEGKKVELDDFGVEYVIKDALKTCGACGEPYRRTHGGWGSVCYSCGEPWFEVES